jgi:hypothetical protein
MSRIPDVRNADKGSAQPANARPVPNARGFPSPRLAGAIGIMLAILLPVIIGFIAMALELGRVYNRKAELQALADGIAVSAAKKLNGSSDGIADALAAAHDVVESADDANTKPHYLYGRAITFADSALKFGSSADGAGGWLGADAAKASPAGIAYVKVDTGDLDA